MHTRKTAKQITLFRYGGVNAGKNLEVRIGSISLGCSPDSIPQEIVDNLTPKELKQLKQELDADLRKLVSANVWTLAASLNDMTSALDSGILEVGSFVELKKAASVFLKNLRRVERKLTTVIVAPSST